MRLILADGPAPSHYGKVKRSEDESAASVRKTSQRADPERGLSMMDISFDPEKSNKTLRERGFDFAFVARIFEGRVVESVDDRTDYGETRMIAIGEIEGRVYKVVYTDRDSVRRIISANRASRQEKRRWQSSA